LLAVLHPVLALASEAGHGAHQAPSIGELLFPVINFSIYLAIVVVYVVPAVREYLRQRHAQIVAAADEAKTALADAERALAAATNRLGTIEEECTGLRDDVVATATQQAVRLHEQARASGERRLRDAGLLAEQERRRALGDVRAEIAGLATRLAEERIRAALGPDDQRAFVDQFLKEAPRP
jgi:F-type H+-transporting ATPase subunit b